MGLNLHLFCGMLSFWFVEIRQIPSNHTLYSLGSLNIEPFTRTTQRGLSVCVHVCAVQDSRIKTANKFVHRELFLIMMITCIIYFISFFHPVFFRIFFGCVFGWTSFTCAVCCTPIHNKRECCTFRITTAFLFHQSTMCLQAIVFRVVFIRQKYIHIYSQLFWFLCDN